MSESRRRRRSIVPESMQADYTDYHFSPGVEAGGFLFIAGQLYVDEEANERIRGAAQGFIAFILWGVGAFVGTLLAGQVLAKHALPVAVNGMAHDWKAIWLTPAWGALAVLVVFVIFFRNPTGSKSGTPAGRS